MTNLFMKGKSKKKPIKKKPKSVFVNLSHTKYLTVRRCIKNYGWKVTGSTSKNILFWCDGEGTIEFAQSLQRWQFFNHFPGMWSIAHKVELVRLYDRMSRALPDVYNFHPKSFMLPQELNALEAFMASKSKRSDRTIIVKPDRGSQGRGIQIIQDYEVIEDYDESAVAQVYLAPLLLNNKKFDLRIYVLVTACDPLRVYIFKEGMVRFCTSEYQAPKSSNLGEAYAHLTNFSLNKKNEAFDFAENKKKLTTVFAELESKGVDVESIQRGIDRIVRLTLTAAQPCLSSSYHIGVSANDGKSRCFEILGFDILIDDKSRPWLLEVNCMPSLASYSEFDAELKTRVVTDTLKIIDLSPHFKRRCMQRFKEMSTQGTSAAKSVFDPVRESEIAATTEWRQLIPIIDDPELESDCARALDVAHGPTKPTRRRSRLLSDESASARPLPKIGHSARVAKTTVPCDEKKEPPRRIVRPSTRSQQDQKPKPKPKPTVSVPKACPSSRLTTPRNVAPLMRLNVIDRRPRYTENMPMYLIHDAREGNCVIKEAEEMERQRTLRRQAQLASAAGIMHAIRSILKDGRNAVYTAPDQKAKGKLPPASDKKTASFPVYQMPMITDAMRRGKVVETYV